MHDGRIGAVKLVDAIPRVVGERQVGDILGEVPIALGTFFPVGFRAAEPTRGDVRFGSVKRVAAAGGEGSMAIAFVHQYLEES